VGIMFIIEAKKRIMRMSRWMMGATRGCRTFIATYVDGMCSGDCFIRGSICSLIRDTLVLGCVAEPERTEGGIRSGLTLAL
jgi:hypothetical protein